MQPEHKRHPLPATPGRFPRSLPDDPLFSQQWHLLNEGTSGGGTGIDLNVASIWDFAGGAGLGTGVVLGIVDSGVQYNHPDLLQNYRPDLSYDFLADDADPQPQGVSGHGTAVAGLAVARGNNGLGVSGVAPGAHFAALRLLAPTLQTDAMEASTLTHQNNNQGGLGTIAIYVNPWGPSDDGRTLAAPGPLTAAALEDGVHNGRGGLGSIFTWAVGNGRGALDNANFDGYSNSRYVIAVGAVTNQGLATSYSEPGANLFVVAPSDGGPGANSDLTSTDYTGVGGYNTSATEGDYVTTFGGTSAAVPLVGGVVALMLEANPQLTWRDVKHILARTAVQNDPTSPGWQVNAAGRHFHHDYGFGLVDAHAAVETSKLWGNIADEVSYRNGVQVLDAAIPDGSGTSLGVPVPGQAVTSTVLCMASLKLETVEVQVRIDHTYRGDLSIVLRGPTGITSQLATIRNDSANDLNWRFSTNAFWGEWAAGEWAIEISDGIINDTGFAHEWELICHGTLPATLPQATLVQSHYHESINLNYLTEPGESYQVFSTASLTESQWSRMGAALEATSTSDSVSFPISDLPEKQFFRAAPVSVLPNP